MDGSHAQEQSSQFLTSYYGPNSSQNHDQSASQQQNQQQQGQSQMSYSTSPPLPHNNQGQQQQQQQPGSNMNLDILGNLMALHDQSGILNPSNAQTYHSNPSQQSGQDQLQNAGLITNPTPQSLLEQQFKLSQLQQLQQLQNQIFQQHIALITQGRPIGELASSDTAVERGGNLIHGLPTPGSSTEIRPQISTDFVSPMILHYGDQQENTNFQHLHNANHFNQSVGSASAPANLAFHTNEDMDFDISPLTSPWLGAQQQHLHNMHLQQQQQPHQRLQRQHLHHPIDPRASKKRSASPDSKHDDDGANQPARKRMSPAVKPTNPGLPASIKRRSTSKQSSTTPPTRSMSTRSLQGLAAMAGVGENDTADPTNGADALSMSMPPPAPPKGSDHMSGSFLPDDIMLTPVTPSSIMNLGRMGITSPSDSQINSGLESKDRAKSKSTTRARSATETSRGKGSKRAAAAAAAAMADSPGADGLPPRKTSHKAAEQKRRDSLKTTFDELRVLLPPIPLPSDENFPDEPILPGALPPRGPPKAGGEGPNKGVSKLQLLRCGNDYIRQLKERVHRRDDEVEDLRREVLRLRGYVSEEVWVGETGSIMDMNRDIDEGDMIGMFRRAAADYDEDDDAD